MRHIEATSQVPRSPSGNVGYSSYDGISTLSDYLGLCKSHSDTHRGGITRFAVRLASAARISPDPSPTSIIRLNINKISIYLLVVRHEDQAGKEGDSDASKAPDAMWRQGRLSGNYHEASMTVVDRPSSVV